MAAITSGEWELARPRILLADDHQLVLDRVSALLHEKFDIVGMAHDGSELISQAVKLSPDLIVADISMPGLSGIDALRRLHEMSKRPRVIFLTIHTEDEFVEACLAEGAVGYVTKSHLKTDLIPTIDAALSGRKHVSPINH
jgi:DNA-binding NarL/FixJ family response regulator